MENQVNPFEVYEKFGGWGIFFALLLPGLPLFFKAISIWSNYRNDSFHLASRRTRRLCVLAEGDSWKTASPVTLQIAVSDALGVVIDDRSIRFVFERHRPISLLKDLKRAGGIVRLDLLGKKFEPARGSKPNAYSYRSKAIATFISGFLPYAAFVLLSPILKNDFPRNDLLLIFCTILLWLPFAFALASTFEAAHRLVEKLDERYPALVPEVDASLKVVPAKTGMLKAFHRAKAGLTEGNIKVFLLFFLFAIFSLVLLYLFADPDAKEKFEFISYAFPCAAGVLAGGALYLSTKRSKMVEQILNASDPGAKKSDEKYFYICSVICLLAGLLAEVLSSKCRSQSVIIVCTAFLLASLFVLVERVLSESKQYGYKSVGVFGWSLTGITTIGALLSLIYLLNHINAFFIYGDSTFICLP